MAVSCNPLLGGTRGLARDRVLADGLVRISGFRAEARVADAGTGVGERFRGEDRLWKLVLVAAGDTCRPTGADVFEEDEVADSEWNEDERNEEPLEGANLVLARRNVRDAE